MTNQNVTIQAILVQEIKGCALITNLLGVTSEASRHRRHAETVATAASVHLLFTTVTRLACFNTNGKTELQILHSWISALGEACFLLRTMAGEVDVFLVWLCIYLEKCKHFIRQDLPEHVFQFIRLKGRGDLVKRIHDLVKMTISHSGMHFYSAILFKKEKRKNRGI